MRKNISSLLTLIAGFASPLAAQEVLTLSVRPVEVSYAAASVVEAVRQSTLAAQVAGRVIEVRAEPGQSVRAGEALVRIDARETAESVAAAKARLVQAEAHYTRTKNLHAQKFISAAALDKAEADLKSARALAAQAGAGHSHATVASPLTGLVAARHVEAGEMAVPDKPLVTVFDPRGLRVVANVPQYKLTALKGAVRAKIEFVESGRRVEATRVEVLPTLDASTHTLTARAYLPAGVDAVLPGMAARVHFIVDTAQKLTLPARAVLRRGEVTGVYVLDAGNVPRLRQVRLGEALIDGEIEVLAGLAPGERIRLDPLRAGFERAQSERK